jgi:hypothetical protein
MEVIRKTSITLKKQQSVFINTTKTKKFLCEKCAMEMLPLQQIALLKGISTRDIYRLIEKGEIHFVETDKREVFVCTDFENNSTLASSSDNK